MFKTLVFKGLIVPFRKELEDRMGRGFAVQASGPELRSPGLIQKLEQKAEP